MGEQRTAAFGAYDVRGAVPDELDEDIVYDIGRAYTKLVKPVEPVAVGRDVRRSSPQLSEALIRGLNDAGADAYDIGLVGTEVVYFASAQEGVGGGIMITASHNPAHHNGMKFVRADAVPISGDSGLHEIKEMVENGEVEKASTRGSVRKRKFNDEYIECVMSFVNPDGLDSMEIVANSGNGCAGPFLDMIAERVSSLEFSRIDHRPDGEFPNGVPNPLDEDKRRRTAEAVADSNAAMGVAWDGDFDRCFFFDHEARFIDGYYLVGLLAERMLEKAPGSAVIHDPRLIWNTIEIVRKHDGRPVQSKTGHAFIKERMRAEDAIYGGEMSAHHYFRDFYYADSGMIPMLLVVDQVSRSDSSLADLVGTMAERFPCSGEQNVELESEDAKEEAMERVREHYEARGGELDTTDGVSVSFERWRFNLRASNTEDKIRLNVETRGDRELLQEKTDEVLELVKS